MTSSTAMPMQLLFTISEVLFILDNKLCCLVDHFDVPALTRHIIFEEILEKVLWQKSAEKLFCSSKVLSIDELRQLYKAVEHEHLSLGADSFEKTFKLACMSLKVQLTRLNQPRDLRQLLNMKMQSLQDLFPNPRTAEDISRIWGAATEYYQYLSPGELNRIRMTILNSLRTVSIPVRLLIDKGIQYKSGHVVPSKFGQLSKKLGYYRIPGNGLKPEVESKFTLAGEEDMMGETEMTADIGNIFGRDRVAAMSRQQGHNWRERNQIDELEVFERDMTVTSDGMSSSSKNRLDLIF